MEKGGRGGLKKNTEIKRTLGKGNGEQIQCIIQGGIIGNVILLRLGRVIANFRNTL